MKLHEIRDNEGAHKRRMRVGRGIGSGKGKTSGRGVKGQKARTGVSLHAFEGGQMPLYRRLPKRGFNTPDTTAEIRLSDLERLAADTVDLDVLKAAGVIPRFSLAAKIIVSGKLSRKLTIVGLRASKGAQAAIEAAGGKVEVPAAE